MLRVSSITHRQASAQTSRDGPAHNGAGRRQVGWSCRGFVVDALAELLATPGEPEDHVFTGPQGGALRASLFRSRFWGGATRAAGLDGLAGLGGLEPGTSSVSGMSGGCVQAG